MQTNLAIWLKRNSLRVFLPFYFEEHERQQGRDGCRHVLKVWRFGQCSYEVWVYPHGGELLVVQMLRERGLTDSKVYKGIQYLGELVQRVARPADITC